MDTHSPDDPPGGGEQGQPGGFLDEETKRKRVEFHLPAVRILVYRRLRRFGSRGTQDVDDVVQEAARRALEGKAPADLKKFQAWLLKRASRAIDAWIEKEGIGGVKGYLTGQEIPDQIDPETSAEEALEHEEIIQAMFRAVETLRLGDQQLLTAYYLERRTIEELAAEEPGRSAKAVRSQLKRAVQAFRRAAKREHLT